MAAAKPKKKTIRTIPQARTPMREQDAKERATNFEEVTLGYSREEALLEALKPMDFIFISASNKTNITELKEKILSYFQVKTVTMGDVMVTNLRHYQNLVQTNDSLDRVLEGMFNGVTGDFLAMDIRQSLHYLGEITGVISTDDLLDNIFSKFCIGK